MKLKIVTNLALVCSILFSINSHAQEQNLTRIISEHLTLKEYQALKADSKQRLIWAFTQSGAYYLDELPTLPHMLGALNLLSEDYLELSFTHSSDEMPEGRVRLIHAFGNVGKISLVRTEPTEYTGIFETGAIGMARLSKAAPTGFTPGMGLKLLIDGRPSVNLMVLNNLDGQKSSNFFELPFTNNLPTPNAGLLKPMFDAFQRTVDRIKPGSGPTYLPLDHFAAIKNDGTVVDSPVTPFEMIFVPTADAFNSQDENISGWRSVIPFGLAKKDFRVMLNQITPPTVLYKVYLKKNAQDKAVLWGELVLESDLIPSKYGDEVLFFQHHL